MIDLLIQILGPTLAQKFFSGSDDLSVNDVAQGLVEVVEDTQKQKQDIENIQKELKGLTPHNLNPQLDAIHKWMLDHAAAQKRTLRDLAQKQHYWNLALACAAVGALFLALVCLVR